MANERDSARSGETNAFLAQLFRAHGVEAIVDGEWVRFPNRYIKANGSVVKESDVQSFKSIQLDIRVQVGLGRILIESFAGFGTTVEQALAEAQQNFTANSFHVILAAFFAPNDDQITREEWIIGGQARQVVLGNVGIRGKVPEPREQSLAWFNLFEEKVKAKKLAERIHWLRLYYAQIQNQQQVCEVLLDNEDWEVLRLEMSAVDWPRSEDFFSVRIFAIIQGGLDVSQGLATVFQLRGKDDAETIRELVARGIPQFQAEKLLALAPLAFGRVLLKSLPIRFSATALHQDRHTNSSEEIQLEGEPIFVEARRLAEQAHEQDTMTREEFGAISFRSPEVDAVNQALNAGSRPEDLSCSPPVVFWSNDGNGSPKKKGNGEGSTTSTVYRVGTHLLVLVGVSVLLLAILGLLILIKNGDWTLLAVIGGVGLVMVLLLQLLRLEIHSDGIKYRDLSGSWTIPFADVRRAYITTVRATQAPQGVGVFWIERRTGKPVKVNLRTFSIQAAAMLFTALESHGIGIEVSDEWAARRLADQVRAAQAKLRE